MKSNILTEQQLDEMVGLYNNHLSVSNLARKYYVSVPTIINHLKTRMDYVGRPRNPVKVNIGMFLRDWGFGVPVKVMKRRYGFSEIRYVYNMVNNLRRRGYNLKYRYKVGDDL